MAAASLDEETTAKVLRQVGVGGKEFRFGNVGADEFLVMEDGLLYE
jgi:hypothetical protein